ncbi:MAG: metallophosphoesterase family protein [Actinomycetota bacterium]
MRVAAIYDIHGNLPALDAVLRDIEEAEPDVILVGGDSASGPFPRATLGRLTALGSHVHVIRGNADRELVDAFDRASEGGGAGEDDIWGQRGAWTAQQITSEQRDFLARLPETKTFDVADIGPVRFCHGSPRNDEEIITAVTSDTRLRRILAGVEEELVVCGHTHIQFDRVVDGTRVVNAGSVGMPYEEEPGAYWALFGPEVSLRRTVYDFDEAAERIRNSGFPEAAEHAHQLFVELPSREETAQFFERLAKEREEAGQEG